MCRRRIQAPDRFFMEFLSGANVSGQPTRTCRCHSKWQISRMQIPRGRRESASTLVRRLQLRGDRSGFAVRGSTAVASPTAARRPWQRWACAGQKRHAIRPWPAVDYAEVRRDVNRTSASLAWIQGCMRAGSTGHDQGRMCYQPASGQLGRRYRGFSLWRIGRSSSVRPDLCYRGFLSDRRAYAKSMKWYPLSACVMLWADLRQLRHASNAG